MRKSTIIFVSISIMLNILLFMHLMPDPYNAVIYFEMELEAENPVTARLFCGEKVITKIFQGDRIRNSADFHFPVSSRDLRLSLQMGDKPVLITDTHISLGATQVNISPEELEKHSDGVKEEDGISIQGGEAWINLPIDGYELPERYWSANKGRYIVYCILVCLTADLLLWFFWSLVTERTHKLFMTLTGQQWSVVVVVFLICLGGAIMLEGNECPDESGRRLLSSYIFANNRLPLGDEPEVILTGWGFSYALRPYLSAMVGTVFMKLASLVTKDEFVLFVMSRMCSVLSITLCCFYCMKLGNELFENRRSSILMSVIVCFLPQVLFLGMYQNNDSLSLLATSMMLFFLVKGQKTGWQVQYCVGLGISFAVCLLSYYSCYPWGLCCMIAFLYSCRNHRINLSRIGIVIGLVFLLAGWFFIRNALINNGDFLGIASETISREKMAAKGIASYAYSVPHDTGISLVRFLLPGQYRWVEMTVRSMIGYFGHMNILLPIVQYGVYYTLVVLGMIVFIAAWFKAERKKNLLLVTMIGSSITTILISLLQSYYRDYQPQGRYIITVVLFVSYMISFAADNTRLSIIHGEDRKTALSFRWTEGIIIIWIVMFACVWFKTMTKMVI